MRTDVIARMTREFRAEGFTLEIDEGVLDYIVAEAQRKETGARGLASSLTRRLEDVAFEAFGGDATAATPQVVRVAVRGDDLAVDVG